MSVKFAVLSGVLLASSAMVACGGGYRYRAGYVAYIAPPPPAPYAVGAVGYAPGPGYVWIGRLLESEREPLELGKWPMGGAAASGMRTGIATAGSGMAIAGVIIAVTGVSADSTIVMDA